MLRTHNLGCDVDIASFVFLPVCACIQLALKCWRDEATHPPTKKKKKQEFDFTDEPCRQCNQIIVLSHFCTLVFRTLRYFWLRDIRKCTSHRNLATQTENREPTGLLSVNFPFWREYVSTRLLFLSTPSFKMVESLICHLLNSPHFWKWLCRYKPYTNIILQLGHDFCGSQHPDFYIPCSPPPPPLC